MIRRFKPNVKKTIVVEMIKSTGIEDEKPCVATQFEQVIAANAEHGYELDSWERSVVAMHGVIRESIIAVFVEIE